jgi:signal transduction histidine kinase
VRLSIDKTDQMDRAGKAVSAEWVRAQLRRVEQRLHRLLETLDRLLDVSRLSSGRIDPELDNVNLETPSVMSSHPSKPSSPWPSVR